MDFPRLIAVLPCYSLDDIPKQLDETSCQEFHAAWTALWHPLVLSRSNSLPEWKRADESSLDLEKSWILCPASAAEKIDTPLMERLDFQGCQLLHAAGTRPEVLALLADSLLPELRSVAEEVAVIASSEGEAVEGARDLWGQPKAGVRLDDFYALGWAFLLVQALTRKIHYSSNLDLVVMADQARSAAEAYLAGQGAEAERWLQACFDQLSQERDRYFNQSAYLLDLCLLAPTTLGASLTRQLEGSQPQNLLANAELLGMLQHKHPETWTQLLAKVGSQQLAIIGGTDRERVHAWSTLGQLQRALQRGRAAYRALALEPPQVFAQYGPGMTMEFPTHLTSSGYRGAILHAFSSGNYPVTSQAKISWEASDTTTLDTLSGSILDAGSYRSLMTAVNELAKQFDHHQVPTLVCTHWPARTSLAFEDLARASRRTTALGQWVTADHYFATTGYVYSHQNFSTADFQCELPNDYRHFSRFSRELMAPIVRGHRLEGLACVGHLLKQVMVSMKRSDGEQEELDGWLRQIEGWLQRCDDSQGSSTASPDRQADTGGLEQIEALREQLGQRLAGLLPRQKQSPAANGSRHWLVINPYCGPRRCWLPDLEGRHAKQDNDRIYESAVRGDRSDVIVDVPPMGVVRLGSSGNHSASSRRQGPNLASPQWLLANEFIECQIDPKKGYLRSLMIAKKRGGRLSGMPAIVVQDTNGKAPPTYSTIEEGRSQIVINTPLHARIESSGELLIDQRPAASFVIGYELWRGARHLKVDLRLESVNGSWGSPDRLWQGAPVWRTAWPSHAADLATWLQGTRTKLRSSRIFAPELLEIDDAEHKIYLAFQGLPLHRRVETAFLDTLLPANEDGIVEATWQVAVDWPRPYQSYLESVDEPWLVPDPGGELLAGTSLWFAQTNQPHVRIELVRSGDDFLRIVLHETHGKETRARLSFFRDAAAAARVACDGQSLEELMVENGSVVVDVKPYEISYVDVRW
jgi:hypothetical protein